MSSHYQIWLYVAVVLLLAAAVPSLNLVSVPAFGGYLEYLGVGAVSAAACDYLHH